MKKHVPTVVAAVIFVCVAIAGAAFALYSPGSPAQSRALDPTVPASRSLYFAATDATRTPAHESTSFSVADAQAGVGKPSLTAPKRVYDRPQRTPGTAKRLAAYGRKFDPTPPEYLLAQGITRIKDAGKRVVITFDDGPSPNTVDILHILTRYSSHATFFFIGGRAENSQSTLRSVLRQGSEIGNHTWQHTDLIREPIGWDEQQILRAEDIFHGLVGVDPVYVRPKGGQIDQAGMDAIKALHKLYVYWDVAGYDTVPEFTAADIRDNVLEAVRPGSIILLHETNPRTVAALPAILDGLHKRGYEVDDLTNVLARR